MSAPALAACAALLAVVAVADLLSDALDRGPALDRHWRAALATVSRAGSEGLDPDRSERRRLLLVGALATAGAGWLVFGVGGAVVAAAVAPTLASRLLRARRTRYREAVEAGAAEIAVALADALSGGHSLRGALAGAAGSLAGPPGNELRRVAAELELGAGTDAALEGMRRRIALPAIDVIVAGALMQRRAGGDLASLLRASARAFEDEARLLGEVRAATAQARFTGLVVVMLPLGGACLAELASPGFVARLAGSPLTGVLVGMAVAMQVAAAFAIRRLARLRA